MGRNARLDFFEEVIAHKYNLGQNVDEVLEKVTTSLYPTTFKNNRTKLENITGYLRFSRVKLRLDGNLNGFLKNIYVKLDTRPEYQKLFVEVGNEHNWNLGKDFYELESKFLGHYMDDSANWDKFNDIVCLVEAFRKYRGK